MENLEINEDMFEEDKINRFLNMIATQYDGNLARQYGESYLKKCNELNKYKQVIDKIKEYIQSLGTQDGMIKDYMIDKNIKETILELLEEIE